jgi:hypothetical protein
MTLDELPGFRRRIRITPARDSVSAALEDDFHCMAVTLRHDGTTITGVAAVTERVPWSTCPGARAVLEASFTGQPLGAAPRDKRANCTHLYDLAVLASAHAGDGVPFDYEVLVGDAVEGVQAAEIRHAGAALLRWEIAEGMVLRAPAAIAGRRLTELRDWIATLPAPQAEAARMLQWMCLVAHGRPMPLEQQNDATLMPANCFTFQPEMAKMARRALQRIDFSRDVRDPLDHFDGERFGVRVPSAGY